MQKDTAQELSGVSRGDGGVLGKTWQYMGILTSLLKAEKLQWFSSAGAPQGRQRC